MCCVQDVEDRKKEGLEIGMFRFRVFERVAGDTELRKLPLDGPGGWVNLVTSKERGQASVLGAVTDFASLENPSRFLESELTAAVADLETDVACGKPVGGGWLQIEGFDLEGRFCDVGVDPPSVGEEAAALSLTEIDT